METITITKRVINNKEVYNKRFDDYDCGFYGDRISKLEYQESKQNMGRVIISENLMELGIVERITYEN